MKLTTLERLTLANQYRILEKVDPDNAAFYKQAFEGTLNAVDAEFAGFDGNEETNHYAYAQFLIETQKKWGESQALNSHRPKVGQYRAMVAAWKETPAKWDLTPNDVARILSPREPGLSHEEFF